MKPRQKKIEQRISPRKPLKTRVIFEDEFGEDFLYFLSTDISLSGLFIESNIKFVPSTKMFLKFSLHENEAPIQVTGEITRMTDPKRTRGRPKKDRRVGIGIRFLGLSASDMKRIERFVRA